MAKAMSASIKTTVCELSDYARVNVVMDLPMDPFPTDVCANVGCALTGVELLVNMDRLGKSLHINLKFSLAIYVL